jgi:hypothetical protein
VLDLKIMNTALLAKWFVRFQDPKVKGQWKTVIQVKYSISLVNISFFWKNILKDKDLVNLDFNKKNRFW